MIEESLDSSGLTVVSTKYLFGFLVPIAFVLRRVFPFFVRRGKKVQNRNPGGSESKHFNKLSLIFKLVVLIEQRIHLRLGLSLFSIGVKPGK
jgi:hypothetical protein